MKPSANLLWLWGAALLAGCSVQAESEYQPVQYNPPRVPMTRLVWQDRADKSIKWADLVRVEDAIQLDVSQSIANFPLLDVAQQELVQMERIDDVLLTGVRDNQRGELQSGWVAIDLGVREEPHGDHSDFSYEAAPRILRQQLDQAQGNPAHLYQYDGAFYLANDSKNGLSQLFPARLSTESTEPAATFFAGGGNHITMAAANHKVCYSSWIDGGGPNKGRVDVVDWNHPGAESIRYSFSLPTGGIHGAIAAEGKIFLAPQDGVIWVEADEALQKSAESVELHHLSLGKDPETQKPLRTGAFTSHRNWVLFTTGKGESAALCLVDAAAPQPEVVKLPFNLDDGLGLVTPEVILTAAGKRLAFLFCDRHEGDGDERLIVVDLDPNGDRNFSDAKVLKTLTVGASQLDGHYGHHSISFDGDGRWGILTNPGDGDLWLLSLADLEVKSKFTVGGTPTKIIAVGGYASKH